MDSGEAVGGVSPRRVSIIILAAGLSTRFGRNKLLEPIGPRTLLERVVSEASKSNAAQVVVVVGYESDKVRDSLKGCDCEIVVNEHFEDGQSSSIKEGLTRVRSSSDALMVLPGDVAGVNRPVINAVIEEYARSLASIVAAAYQGKAGHPILFDRSLLPELRDIDEETRGLKKVVGSHRPEMRLVETSPAALIDIDTQEDLTRLSRASVHLS